MSDRCKSHVAESVVRPVRVGLIKFFSIVLVTLVAPIAQAGPMAVVPKGKSFFFATREACVASEVFTRQECAMAFANVRAELADRAPTFASVFECRLRFGICEARRDRAGFSPTGIGVEIVVSAQGVRVVPAMAVETPGRLFPKVPLTREYAAQGDFSSQQSGDLPKGDSSILPTDRFEPFAKRPEIQAQFSFNYSSLGAIEGGRPQVQETAEQRRARLRSAPFIR